MSRVSNPCAIRALSCGAFALILAACGGSDSSGGPNGPPALNNTIVFVSDRTGADQIHVMNGNGDIVRLIATTTGAKSDPVVSPDGRRIVFTLGANDVGDPSPLWIVSSDGTGLAQLTTDGANDIRPAWSPDGKKIAFASNRDDNFEIYVMNADGSGQTNITNNDANDISPTWSPDGNTILFSSDRDSEEGVQIYSMTSTGGSVSPLVHGYDPEWSPSGSRFLFLRGSQIWISDDATGTSVRQVTTDANLHLTPGWSPDESKLIFASAPVLDEEIFTVASAGGTAPVALTLEADGDNFTPSWTRH
jgi:Tol biopolymer transport system component